MSKVVRWNDYNSFLVYGYDSKDMLVAKVSNEGTLEMSGIRETYATKDAAMRAAQEYHTEKPLTVEGKKPMLTEVTQDAKKFISDNRTIIYWIALIFLADYFFFNGAFRSKLNALVEKMIGRAEKALDKE